MEQRYEAVNSQPANAIGTLPPGLLAGVALRAQSPGLPEGVWRDDCLEAAIEALRSALTPSTERVLRFYVRQTRPADWSEAGRGPVAYVAQRVVAEKLGLDRRSIYRAECDLERLGLIIKLSSDNGRRYGPQGGEAEACGLYFTPMIEGYAGFVAASAEAAALRDQLVMARKLASSSRFRLRHLARAGGDRPEARAGLALLDGFPSGIMSMTDIDLLREMAAEFSAHIAIIEAANGRDADPSQAVDISEKPSKMSHGGGENVPRHRYTTNNSPFVKSNRNADKRTASHEADDKFIKTSAYADEGLRKKDAKGRCGVKMANDGANGNVGTGTGEKARNNIPTEKPAKVIWSMGQLFWAASVEFRALMDANRDHTGQIHQWAFIDAAQTMRHILGISQSAWGEACHVMGRNEAALALMVIDRNRSHPTHPVKNPGGAFRAMIERAQTDQLNLDASIFAIIKRTEKESIN